MQHLSNLPWMVMASQTSDLALAPLQRVRRHLSLVALALGLLSIAALWLRLGQVLRPLQHIGRRIANMAQPGAKLEPLPLQPTQELQQLVRGFNHLQQELARRNDILSDSEQRYRTTFMLSPDALEITRISDGRILDVNDGFERVYGWTREQAIGRTEAELQMWPPGQEGEFDALMQSLLAGEPCRERELNLQRNDGSPVTVLVSAKMLELQGQPCVLWVSHDLTPFRQAHAQIERLRTTDALTGLPNRAQFVAQLARIQAQCVGLGQLGGLLFLDLVDFKTVNDTQGHSRGDVVLQKVAQRIQASIPELAVVSRPSADEFLIALPHLPSNWGDASQQVEQVVARLSAALALPVELGSSQPVHTSINMGVLLFGNTPEEPTELLRKVDLALNQAKAAGPGSVLFYETQMLDLVSTRARLQHSLREALHRQHFVLHYQPQVNGQGRVIGVEALIRWHLEGKGMVSPAEFIPLAEKTGLIVPLGRWVLHTACNQLAQWAKEPAHAHLDMAVNVSAGQFQQADFVQQVEQALAETGAPAQRLKLELTESLMMENMEQVIAHMKAIRNLGVRFSLDDFGTGFSSLSYLKLLPLNQLKIDQGFVRDILEDHNDAAIARTVIALGESLGLEVIAEGVETQAHRDLLAQWGCHLYQGYWFSKPLPIEALHTYLASLPP